jgi:DNA-binding SARP family transcriptional activator
MAPQGVAEFKILGPLEVTVGPTRLELGGTRQQVVLAMLLLSVNHPVDASRLEQAIYGETLPPTSRSQVHISISLLRRLFAAHGSATAISTQRHGYMLRVDDLRLDARRFTELTAAASAARAAGEAERAVAHYRDALRLWRGPALEGIDSLLVRAAATQLDEQRITAIEDRLALELDLGRAHELVGEITGLIEEFPLRERLRGQLMLALYRSGRAAEALRIFRQTRRLLVEELGIEPGAELHRLQHAILTADAALDPPAASPIVPIVPVAPSLRRPRLLPADIADFTGRAKQVSMIRQRLTQAATGSAQLAVPVVVITGAGGLGKTSLAVHASHLLADEFVDGQLFADLHGGTGRPAEPAHVLERFLLALGVPGGQMPDGLDERAEAYRSLLAGRRVLVVLDDATAESQVTPLVPGNGAAAILVTSRSMLAGLAGATRILLDVFDAGQSLDLLGRIVGTDRVRSESAPAAVVATQCGHLPLALRIAGARLAVRPHWGIQQLADRLADQARRLDELELGEIGVRASISLSYYAADEQTRRLMRRLALLEAPAFSGWMSAALLDQPLAEADGVLDGMITAQLVETVGPGPGAAGQYRFHELIRLFARERLAAEEPAAEQQAALERVLGALLHLAEAARARLNGGSQVMLDSDAQRWPLPEQLTRQLVSDPIAWFERERAALVAGVRQAAEAGLTELCWSLAMTAETGFELRTYLDDWRQTCDVALEASRRGGNLRGQAAMLYSRGSLHQENGRFDASRLDLSAAAHLFTEAGDAHGFALSVGLIALLDRINGQLDQAADGFNRALSILRTTGDQVTVAYLLQNLARLKLESGEPDAAGELLDEALRLTDARGRGRVRAQVLYASGQARLQAGDATGAAAAFDRTLTVASNLGDQIGQAYALTGTGVAALRLRDLGRAHGAFQRALELASTVGDPLAAGRAQLGLSELALSRGEAGQAAALAALAADAFRQCDAPLEEARARALLADANSAGGDRAGDLRASENRPDRGADRPDFSSSLATKPPDACPEA